MRSSAGTSGSSAGRRLLVVTYHFPPDGAVGGLRWAGFAKYLVRRGWAVDVVTASADAAGRAIPGVTVHVTPRRRTVNDLYNQTADRFKHGGTSRTDVTPASTRRVTPTTALGAAPAHTSVRRHTPLVVRAVGAVRGVIARSLDFPDISRGWIMRAAATTRGLLAEHDYDAVVSSGPPHLAHLAAILATIGSDVPHWVDMRDPWSAFYPKSRSQPIGARVEARLIAALERVITQRAHGVIANTPEFAAALRRALPRQRVHCVPNAVDLELLPPRAPAATDACRVVYIGTLYAKRNLTSVITAMGALVRDTPAAATRLRLTVLGHLTAQHRLRFLDELSRHGLQDMVELRGVLSRADALVELSRAHLALVLAQDQPFCVPAKLYESVALAVPTLAITESGSATEREAARVGAMSVDPANPAGIQHVLAAALNGQLNRVSAPVPVSYAERVGDIERVLGSGERSGAENDDTVLAASVPAQ